MSEARPAKVPIFNGHLPEQVPPRLGCLVSTEGWGKLKHRINDAATVARRFNLCCSLVLIPMFLGLSALATLAIANSDHQYDETYRNPLLFVSIIVGVLSHFTAFLIRACYVDRVVATNLQAIIEEYRALGLSMSFYPHALVDHQREHFGFFYNPTLYYMTINCLTGLGEILFMPWCDLDYIVFVDLQQATCNYERMSSESDKRSKDNLRLRMEKLEAARPYLRDGEYEAQRQRILDECI